ncbi:MAG: PadR family transcriptional regulator [Thaumarchaeota archaeon]|nr:PadR family transcriptional regulator [Nitrososphaerota archaeon]MCL5317548.1 PadR family transcriptional regulator [Nitrososphaerota archaeon]
MKPSELVSAPRGLLKVFIIDLASKYPVSGIEVTEQVGALSKGVWKPSPGSIYYILKELVSKKRLSEIYTPDKGVKKYVATEKGLEDLRLFRSFGNEILQKQAAFMSLTSQLIQDEAATKALNIYISELKKSEKP